MSDRPNEATLLPEPPAFPEAEAGLLGAVLYHGDYIHLIADVLEDRHFSQEAYGRLWSVLARCAERNEPISMISVIDATIATIGWERSEVVRFLTRLIRSVPIHSGAQVKHYAMLVRDAWIRRQLWEAADQIKLQARSDSGKSGASILEDVEAKLFGISVESDSHERVVSLSDALAEAMRQAHAAVEAYELGQVVGVRSGLTNVDKKLGGFRNSDFIVIGGATSMGKTSLGLRFAISAAEQFMAADPVRPQWVYFASLEMSSDQLALRLACAESRVSFERVRNGHCSVDELMRLEDGGRRIRDLPIRIDDSGRSTVSAIRTRARRWKRKHGLGMLVVDYLQLMGLTKSERNEAGGNRVQEMSTITRNCKGVAKDLDVPFLALAQLSRELEKREDKRPQMSDLRESGTIEQDADVVMFVYREAYYLQRRPPAKKERESEIDYQVRRTDWSVAVDKLKDSAEVITAKNRHGSLSSAVVRFTPELMLFEDDTPGDATMTEERQHQLRMDLQVLD